MGQYYEFYIAIAQAAVVLRTLQISGHDPDSLIIEAAIEELDAAIEAAEEAGAI